MRLNPSPRATVDFVKARAVRATLSLIGAACGHTPRRAVESSRDVRRPSTVSNIADRRRKPSGEDDQHLYTVNL